MPDGIHPTVHAVQPAIGDAPLDSGGVKPKLPKLGKGDDAVLSRRQPRQ
jgi:hypothetical protein